MTKEMDKKDWKILYQLCQNSRMSHNSIAKLVGASKNSVTYRVNRLLSRGIISGFFTIVDIAPLGAVFYTLLLKLNATKEREKEFLDYLKPNDKVSVIDGFVGEWNFLVEFCCKNPYTFFEFLADLKGKFSDIVEDYEVHQTLEIYKVEQLPVELVRETTSGFQAKTKPGSVKLDRTEIKLLSELNKNSTAPLLELADKIGVTYKTVSAKIKELKESGIIIKFTANISLESLGYDVYLILLDLRNLSIKRESDLKAYINSQKNIRSAFISAAKPTVFIYIAVKSSLELQHFLVETKRGFRDIIVNQNYLLSSDQIKCELFPDGILE